MGKAGRVFLVGAGPGDPGLVTLRAAECLQRADVVFYDYLVNPRVLDQHVRPDAELVGLGRQVQGRDWTPAEINARVVDLARAGKTVVRLKGGDPIVFARIAEEIEPLAAQGVAWEIVPGVTAALAAGSYAGIPLTHRDCASAVALVAGQEKRGKAGLPLDYGSLAAFPGTLVFYMGVNSVSNWSAALISAGRPADTPVAIVRRCSLPDQETVTCSLGELPDRLTPAESFPPPVVIVVGEAARRDRSLSWFERRPLFGVRVMVTRPRRQAAALAGPLADLGADVIVQPAIEISDPPDWTPVDSALARLNEFDWLVFSSANGVQSVLDRLRRVGRDLRCLASLRLAAIGPGTSAELDRRGLRADLQPSEYRAEALAESLANDAAGRRFLLARASRGREVLAEQLIEAGGQVEQIVVYSSTDTTAPSEANAELVRDAAVDWITVTSSAIARSLASMFGEDLRRCRLASISPVTSATLRELGLAPAAEARQYTIEGLIEAILERHAGSALSPPPCGDRRSV